MVISPEHLLSGVDYKALKEAHFISFGNPSLVTKEVKLDQLSDFAIDKLRNRKLRDVYYNHFRLMYEMEPLT